MFPFLVLAGCLERVTGVAVPLDPRFYEGAAEANDPAALRPTLGAPWEGHSGATVEVKILLEAPLSDAAQVDFWLPDEAAPGGQLRIGTADAAPGETMTLAVPVEVTTFRVEAFQDPDGDGPSDVDPWGSVDVEVGTLTGPVSLVLLAGGRGTSGSKQSESPWNGVEGARTTVSGTITSDRDEPVQIDVNQPDPAAPGGQLRVGAVRLTEPGTFEIEVPESVQSFKLEAFQDFTGDGPSADDAYGERTVIRADFGAAMSLPLVVGARSLPGSGGSEGGSGGETPWGSVEGEKRSLSVTLITPGVAKVQVDVSELDPAAKGGQTRVGKIEGVPADGKVSFILAVPVGVAKFKLECFQDAAGDGPTNDDPYAELLVTTASAAEALELKLIEGARGKAGGGGGGGGQRGPDFGDVPLTKVGGAVTASSSATIKVDIFKIDPSIKAGRSMLMKVEAADGRWEAALPVDFGPIAITAYQDVTDNGYGPDDPQRNYTPTPVTVGSSEQLGLDIALP